MTGTMLRRREDAAYLATMSPGQVEAVEAAERDIRRAMQNLKQALGAPTVEVVRWVAHMHGCTANAEDDA